MAMRRKHTPQQVVCKLATADRMLNDKGVADVCCELQVSDVLPVAQPVRRDDADNAKRLNDLERENATLKRLLADAELEKAHTQGDFPGKLPSPERRRAAVHQLIRTMKVSERFACGVTGRTDPPSGGLQPTTTAGDTPRSATRPSCPRWSPHPPMIDSH
jgi:putative transposase